MSIRIMKKKILFIIISIIFISTKIFAVSKSCSELVLNDKWKFSTGDNLSWANPKFNDSNWRDISSRFNWENQGVPEYDGYGWYRKQIILPESLITSIKKNGGIIVKYNNADDVDELYFNGHKIGITGSFPPNYISKYNTKRKYTIPIEYIIFDRPNTIAIRVYDGGGDGGLITQNTIIRAKNAVDAIQLKYSLPVENGAFYSSESQYIKIKLKNTSDKAIWINTILKISTDNYIAIDSINFPVKLRGNSTLEATIPFKLTNPGFYRFKLFLQRNNEISDPEKFNIGYEPEKIISIRDAKPDFESFWTQTLSELNKVEPKFKMKLIPEQSTGMRNIYQVEMMSFGNIKIEGFYACPKKEGKYPAIASFMGYGSGPYYPLTDSNIDFAEIIISVRGQGIQKANSAYGDWITWGLESKENYYYRGAFMDLVRAVDFLVSRPEVDANKIVAEGGSQGGAFTIVAAALDHRIKAAAPSIPFLSDYRDYFQIAPWPRSSFETYLKLHPNDSWDRIYDLMSYFDIKNFSSWILCPIFMAVGLQDEVCPNHINFAAYNLIQSKKRYIIYPDQGHGTPSAWSDLKREFFLKNIE